MEKEEMKEFKEELFKEIRELEKKLNIQILVKSQELEEKNRIFIDEFKLLLEKQKALASSITSQKMNIEKIADLENFRKKIESMMITHEIRINNSMKDIQGINFKLSKDISESITVPGYVGPSCKYKTIQAYITSNIADVDRIKTDFDTYKKDAKDIKKKMEEIIKTTLNLVDGSSTKCIQYVDNKMKTHNEFANHKIEELHNRIIGLRALIMTQEKLKEYDNNFANIEKNYYKKKDIDDMINQIIDNFNINLDNFKVKYNEEMDYFFKINNDKLDNVIKESNKSIKDLKSRISTINQVQNQLLKHSVSTRNLNNNNEANLNNNYNNSHNINLNNNHLRNVLNSDESQLKLKKFNSGNKILDSIKIDKKEEYNIDNENNNISNAGSYKYNTININDEKTKMDRLNNSSTKIVKFPLKKNKLYSEDNKNSINEYKNKINISRDENNISLYKSNSIDKENNSSQYYTSATKKRKNENNYYKNILTTKKEYNNNILHLMNKNNNNLLNNNNNQKFVVKSMETIDNNNYNINDKNNMHDSNNNTIDNNIMNIINDNNPSFIESINRKNSLMKRKYSLHELASMNFDEKANEILPTMKTFSSINSSNKTRNTNTPVIKNVFQQSVNNYKIKQNLNINTPVKITSSFGRTGYTLYDKKEEGINNLIKIGLNKKLKKERRKSIDIKFELSPVSKIKLYENI